MFHWLKWICIRVQTVVMKCSYIIQITITMNAIETHAVHHFAEIANRTYHDPNHRHPQNISQNRRPAPVENHIYLNTITIHSQQHIVQLTITNHTRTRDHRTIRATTTTIVRIVSNHHMKIQQL